MASGDPWSLIRWNRRFFFALPLVFALGVALGSFLFPTLRPDQLMERIAIPLVVGGWIVILWPTPCPRCRQCFPIWNLPNWGYWLRLYVRYAPFAPFRYLAEVVRAPCPHCKLPFGADVGSKNA